MCTVLNEATRKHTREKSHEEEEKHGKHLPEKDSHVCILSFTLSALLSLLSLLLWPGLPGPWLVAKEHKVEEVFRRHEVCVAKVSEVAPLVVAARCSASLGLSLLKSIGIANLIVLTALLGIGKASHGCVDFFECFVCLGGAVLIWVHLETLLLIRRFQGLVIGILAHTQQLVIVLASKNVSRYFLLLGREFSLGRLRGGSSLLHGWTGCSRAVSCRTLSGWSPDCI